MPYHVFGRSLAVVYTPLVNGEPVSASALVSARLYSTTPSEAQLTDTAAALTDNLIEAITSWTSQGQDVYEITFAPVTDPSPGSTTGYEVCPLVVNFRYEPGGPTVYTKEVLHIYRADAWTSRISTTFLDVYAIDEQIELFKRPAQVETYIDRATRFVINKLKGQGFEPEKIFNWPELDDAVAYYAAAFISRSLSNESNDIWFTKYEDFRTDADDIMKNSKLGYDIGGGDTPSPGDSADLRTVYLIR